MRASGCISIAVLLSACAAQPTVVTSGVETIEVPVPVVQKCVRREDVPPPPAPLTIAPNADIEQRAAWAQERDGQLRAYIEGLRVALLRCANATP